MRIPIGFLWKLNIDASMIRKQILYCIFNQQLACFSTLQLYAEKVATRGLCAIAQAESLRYKLLGGLAVRR